MQDRHADDDRQDDQAFHSEEERAHPLLRRKQGT
jgi:hypothetical protein